MIVLVRWLTRASPFKLKACNNVEIDPNPELNAEWLRKVEKEALFATVELAQAHVAEVKARRLPEIDKVEVEVKTRLSKNKLLGWSCRCTS